MYGDPTTTPGGAAIPFHSSVRLKLGAGQQIKDGDDVIGINVSAKTIKNKVAAPFRTVKFQIHFGKGIREHEEIFDILRKHGPETIDGKMIEVGGSGAWKNYSLTNVETGEIIDEKKFHKAKFDELLSDPKYSAHIDNLLEKAMVKILNDSAELDINVESYEEMKAVALEIEDSSDGYNDLI
jgi:recombination protein RecA